MRRILRCAFAFLLSVPSVILATLLAEHAKGEPLFALAFVVAGSFVLHLGLKSIRKEYPVVFWVGVFPNVLLFFVALPATALNLLYIETFADFLVRFTLISSFALWYWVSTRIFKLSRDEELRTRETPSETELRRAHERRDPALDAAEREHYEKMLASMPESEREALLKKQKVWEEQHKLR